RGIRSLRVGSRTVMRRAERAESLRIGSLKMLERDDGVRALQAENVTDGRVGRWIVLPKLNVFLQSRGVLDLHHLFSFFHRAIPSQLPLCLRPGLLRGMPAGQWVAGLDVAGDLRRDAQTD